MSLTPPGAGSDHLPPDLLSQSGRATNLGGRAFSVSGLTIYSRPTVWTSTRRLIDCRYKYFADDWSPL